MARGQFANSREASLPGSPFQTQVNLNPDRVVSGAHPINLRWLSAPGFSLELKTAVTFLVGENRSGKSTLLEALAWRLGYNAQGGNKDNSFAEDADGRMLGDALQLGFLAVLHRLSESKAAQLIIATHSPILMTLPGATILSFDSETLQSVDYGQPVHFQISKDCRNATQRFYRHLLDDSPTDESAR